MTSKYQTDDSEFIDSLSSQYKNITRQPLFKIKTEKIDDGTEELQASQLSYFTPDHTHYCLNCKDCKDWYPSTESVFECKIEHATVFYCVCPNILCVMRIRDKRSETLNYRNSSDLMKRSTTERNNEFSYHLTRSVILLLAFTVLMAAAVCLFAYLFDQISGI